MERKLLPGGLETRNVIISGRRTSMRLEPEMWDAIDEICAREGLTLHQLCTHIDRLKQDGSLTAATRVFIMRYFRAAATDAGHAKAGHGERSPPADRYSPV